MRAAGCGVEELVWHYIWMVSGRCWGAGLHVGVRLRVHSSVLQTEFCYNQLHPSETAKTITILDVQGVGIRDLGVCLCNMKPPPTSAYVEISSILPCTIFLIVVTYYSWRGVRLSATLHTPDWRALPRKIGEWGEWGGCEAKLVREDCAQLW